MTEKFITFGKPDISLAEKTAVMDVLESGWLSTGPYVQMLESEFEKYMGRGYAVAVSSCTEALVDSLILAGVKYGDEVITSPMTFCATVNAILQVGAIPVFVDVTKSGHIDPDLIEKAITPNTRAVLPIDYLGAPCDMAAIQRIAIRHNLEVIEDAAHGFGGEYDGRKIGAYADYACFSLYPTKNITAGEGGIVVVKDIRKAQHLKMLIQNGLSLESWKRYGNDEPKTYEVVVPGRKGNMSDIHAAIAHTQFKRWPEIKEKRDVIWNIYEEAFGQKEKGHSRHLFTIRGTRRDDLRKHLHQNGIGTGIHFKALHLEPAYRNFGTFGYFPRAESISAMTLSLPIISEMTVDDAHRVVSTIKDFVKDSIGVPNVP